MRVARRGEVDKVTDGLDMELLSLRDGARTLANDAPLAAFLTPFERLLRRIGVGIGAVELAEEIFHMPVRLGVPHSVRGLSDVVRNPIYSTGVGLLTYGLQKQSDGVTLTGINSNSYGDEPKAPVLERLKRWVQGNF